MTIPLMNIRPIHYTHTHIHNTYIHTHTHTHIYIYIYAYSISHTFLYSTSIQYIYLFLMPYKCKRLTSIVSGAVHSDRTVIVLLQKQTL